ncbi:MAG: energy transducer TonB [Acidobacteriota bacterium]
MSWVSVLVLIAAAGSSLTAAPDLDVSDTIGRPAYHVRILRARLAGGFPGSALFRPDEVLIPSNDTGFWGQPDQIESLRKALGATTIETTPGLVTRSGEAPAGGPYRFRTTLGTEVVDMTFLGEPLGDGWHRISIEATDTSGEELLHAVIRVESPATVALFAPLPDGETGMILAVTPLSRLPAAGDGSEAGTTERDGGRVHGDEAPWETFETDRTVRIAGVDGITNPERVTSVIPVYPKSARQAGLAGKVFLEVVIGVDGSVSHVVVLSMTEEAEWLAGAAVEAVRQWRYRPATTANGQHPVPVLFNIVMTFTLNDDGEDAAGDQS